jgi:HupE / UreJ protein
MRLFGVAVAAALALVLPDPAAAHDIPNDITIRAFMKPEGSRLRLVIRVPLASINDIDWPLKSDGTLDLARADRALHDASTQWLADFIELYEGNTRLGYPRVVDVRASLPADGSFDSYDRALAHVTGPALPGTVEFVLSQGMLDALFEYSIQSDRSNFAIQYDFMKLGVRVLTVLRFLAPSGVVRAFELHDNPGLVRLDPSWLQAAWRFGADGFFHILDGTDHLLFLFCLIIPFRRIRSLLPIITSFTVAHSVTLIASAYDMAPSALWFPPLIDALIATSILYMALENLVAPSLRRRWMIAFGFGLVHGFSFAFALRQTAQFAGAHVLASLLAFNVGIELGQLLVLLMFVPLLVLLFRFVVDERIGTVILSALVAHTGWHWTLDRYSTLSRFQFEWPVLDAAFFVIVLRWLMLLVALAGVAWLIFGVLGRGGESTGSEEVPT